MARFRKGISFGIISVFITLFLTNIVYGIDLSGKTFLRVPFSRNYNRMEDVVSRRQFIKEAVRSVLLGATVGSLPMIFRGDSSDSDVVSEYIDGLFSIFDKIPKYSPKLSISELNDRVVQIMKGQKIQVLCTGEYHTVPPAKFTLPLLKRLHAEGIILKATFEEYEILSSRYEVEGDRHYQDLWLKENKIPSDAFLLELLYSKNKAKAEKDIYKLMGNALNSLGSQEFLWTHSHVLHLSPESYTNTLEKLSALDNIIPLPRIWTALTERNVNLITINYVPIASLLGKIDLRFMAFLELLHLSAAEFSTTIDQYLEKFNKIKKEFSEFEPFAVDYDMYNNFFTVFYSGYDDKLDKLYRGFWGEKSSVLSFKIVWEDKKIGPIVKDWYATGNIELMYIDVVSVWDDNRTRLIINLKDTKKDTQRVIEIDIDLGAEKIIEHNIGRSTLKGFYGHSGSLPLEIPNFYRAFLRKDISI